MLRHKFLTTDPKPEKEAGHKHWLHVFIAIDGTKTMLTPSKREIASLFLAGLSQLLVLAREFQGFPGNCAAVDPFCRRGFLRHGHDADKARENLRKAPLKQAGRISGSRARILQAS